MSTTARIPVFEQAGASYTELWRLSFYKEKNGTIKHFINGSDLDSRFMAYDFDSVKNLTSVFPPNTKKALCSADALLNLIPDKGPAQQYLVEFKSGFLYFDSKHQTTCPLSTPKVRCSEVQRLRSDAEIDALKRKMSDSVLLYHTLTKHSLDQIRSELGFILVYDDVKNRAFQHYVGGSGSISVATMGKFKKRTRIAKGRRVLPSELMKMSGVLFRDVQVLDKSSFLSFVK